MSINVKTSGWIMGRNGLFDIVEVELTTSYEGKKVIIDGIGKRGTRINGGMEIEAKAMTELAIEWLNSQGFETGFLPTPNMIKALYENGRAKT